MTQNQDKKKIISELEMMKGYELSAKDFYVKISSDPKVQQQPLKDAFEKIAEDEKRHAQIVQQIIDIVDNAL